MTPSRRSKLNRIVSGGTIIAMLTDNQSDINFARIYANSESRGYHTGFNLKRFHYLVPFADGLPINFHGMNKDPRRKALRDHCKQHDIKLNIINNEMFEAFIK